MQSKKILPFKEIVNVNFGILGLEFCWALLLPNCSTLLLFLGATPSMLAYLWLLPPLLGLIVNPVIGQLSDLTTSRFGKRRPYIFLGLIAVCLFCFAIPYAGSLWMGTLILSILIVVLNVAQNPIRALAADIIPKHQLTQGFSVQMIFLGLGAMLGAAMPWLLKDYSAILPGTYQPSSLSIAFFIGGVLSILTGIWTCFKIKEKPANALSGNANSILHGLKQLWVHIFDMPKLLKQISLVQFLMWIGFFILFAYFNLGIAQSLFGLPNDADISQNPHSVEIMKRATAYNSLCFIFFQFSSFLMALTIPLITRWLQRKHLASLSLALGGIGLLGILFLPMAFYLPAAILLGITWGCASTIHLAMIASHLPAHQMGLYTGLFPIANCLSQLFTGLLAGPIIKYFLDNQVAYLISLSGIFLLIAAIYNQSIKDEERS